VAVWLRLNGCPSVTSLHGVFQDCTSVYLVQELCSGGDLQSLMDAQERLSEQEAAQAALSILATLAECHERGICYGDVKVRAAPLPGRRCRAAQLHAADSGAARRTAAAPLSGPTAPPPPAQPCSP
jgi:serine/threonine protein kinase